MALRSPAVNSSGEMLLNGLLERFAAMMCKQNERNTAKLSKRCASTTAIDALAADLYTACTRQKNHPAYRDSVDELLEFVAKGIIGSDELHGIDHPNKPGIRTQTRDYACSGSQALLRLAGYRTQSAVKRQTLQPGIKPGPQQTSHLQRRFHPISPAKPANSSGAPSVSWAGTAPVSPTRQWPASMLTAGPATFVSCET